MHKKNEEVSLRLHRELWEHKYSKMYRKEEKKEKTGTLEDYK